MNNAKVKRNRGAQKGNGNTKGNKGGTGAPEKYRTEYDQQAYKLCLLGATDKELADFFEIAVSTLKEWRKQYLSFSASIKKGKMIADAEVSEKLFQRATGYQCPDVDIKVIKNRIVKTKLIKQYPPDTTAGIFWLKNRRKLDWREKYQHEIDFNNYSDEELDTIARKLAANAKKM